jgi:hypothetical protein
VNQVRYGDFTKDELARRLISDTDGNWPFQAAARLIVEHGRWLEQDSFYEFLRSGVLDGEVWIGVDWPSVAKALREKKVEGEASDIFILSLAASCAGYFPVILRDVTNQTPRSMTAIMRAIATAGGYGEDVDEVCSLLL